MHPHDRARGGLRPDRPVVDHRASGETVAMATTLGDELVVARYDRALGASYQRTVFDFARHRRPRGYGLIVERTGAVPPP
jgi:N-carbamoyl-D-amino-acid hydrolase